MLAITAKLTSVATSTDQNTNKVYHRLVFLGKQYDYRVKQEIDHVQEVSISSDHTALLGEYRSAIGQTISIPVEVRQAKNGLWFLTDGNGRFVVQPSAPAGALNKVG